MKIYVVDHLCMLGGTKNKRVTAHAVVKRFPEIISGMPTIRPRHLKAMLRKEMGVFITNKVCIFTKAIVLKKIKVLIREDFMFLTNYAVEFKHSNPGRSVNIVSAGIMHLKSLF